VNRQNIPLSLREVGSATTKQSRKIHGLPRPYET